MDTNNVHPDFDPIIREHCTEILDSIYDGILIVNAAGIVMYVNPEYLRIVQITASDILGKPLRSVRPGALLPQVVSSGKSVEGAYRREGNIEYVVDMSPIFREGRIVGGISVVKDVTEVQRLSKELERYQRNNKRLRTSIRRINAARYSFDDIVYQSPNMGEVIGKAKAMALSSADVLITGESGTGKEVFAQAIHNASSRSRGPFLAINCATLAPNVIESELFGYADGAFTGARRGGKAGFFEVAEGGTVFLDEVTELSIGAQAKLLRVLQERTVRRVGETDEIPMDVRVITASNRNLPELIEKGLFRNDLYYRLNTLHLDLPPLRERGGDVAALARFFYRRFAGLEEGEGAFSPAAIDALRVYSWPGNVRELRNTVEYAVHMGAEKCVETLHLPNHLVPGHLALGHSIGGVLATAGGDAGAQTAMPPLPCSLAEIAHHAEKEAIAAKLREHGGSLEAKKRIAVELGVSLTTLYAKIGKYGL
ncbi:MAG: Arginine utilization regulatory protein RocR [Desulfovibrio sp.]